MLANDGWDLTLILLTWTIWRAPTNASKWRMGFNSAFKGLIMNVPVYSVHTAIVALMRSMVCIVSVPPMIIVETTACPQY